MHSLECFYYGIDWRLAKIAITGVAVFLISGYTVISPRSCQRREKKLFDYTVDSARQKK